MKERPRLILEPTRTDLILESLGFIGLIALWLLTLYIYPRLPETIPIHFNIKGEVDGYGERNMVWLAPGIALILFVVLTLLNRHPHQFNYSIKITEGNALRQYTLATRMIRTLKLSLILIFILLQWTLLRATENPGSELNKFFLPVVLLLILAPIGYFVWQSIRHK